VKKQQSKQAYPDIIPISAEPDLRAYLTGAYFDIAQHPLKYLSVTPIHFKSELYLTRACFAIFQQYHTHVADALYRKIAIDSN
jgi:hypothetical protein